MSEPAVTPETGTAPNGLMSEEAAVAHVASLLDGGAKKEPEPKAKLAQPAAEEPQAQPEQEAQVEEAQEEPQREEEPAETEPEEEAQELPRTLDALAEALDMKAEDLADYLSVPVKVSGERSEVTLAEAIKGYQREGHYSRLMDEVAEQKRQIEAQTAEQQTKWQERWQGMEDMATLLQSRLGNVTPEMRQKILEEQGIEALKTVELQMEQDKAILQKIGAERERMGQEQMQKMAQYRAEQQKLLAAVDPDFLDTEKAHTAQREMTAYLKGRQFTDEEISGYFNGPFDHRYVQVIRDAARWRELQSKAPTVSKEVKKAVPVLKKAGAAADGRGKTDKLASLRKRVTKLSEEYAPKGAQEAAAVDLISEMIRGK